MPASLSSLLPALLKASWQGGVLILLVLAARRIVGRRLHPRGRYALWILVMIRLALPWTMPAPVSVFNLFELSDSAPAVVSVNLPPGGPDTSSATSATEVRTKGVNGLSESPLRNGLLQISSLSLLLMLWLAGALALAIYILAAQSRFSKCIAGRRPLVDEAVLNLLEDCKQRMGVRVPITLIETNKVGSPALFGFIRPRLLLPEGLTRDFSAKELRYVFLHELAHLKRRDIPASWFMAALQILHWFNPLVWLAFHRMRVDREVACDALALSFVRAGESQPYGRTIIKLLESFGRSTRAPSLAGTVENKNQLKERIAMIAAYKNTNRGLALAVVLFAVLGMVTLTDAEPGASQLSRDLIGTWVCVGRPGEVGQVPAIGGRSKSLTATHWSLTQADPVTGETLFHHGGTWKLKGDVYSETVEFANKNTSELIHHTFKFHLKLEGDELTLIGIGNPWKEVWKRVKSDAAQPKKAGESLEGKWVGTEAGKEKEGKSILILQGSKLELNGPGSNEWYKATATAYDTMPKQLVVGITDCSAPEFVGMTSYSIYKLQNGTLTITGNAPGNPTVPAGFDVPGARKFVFKRE